MLEATTTTSSQARDVTERVHWAFHESKHNVIVQRAKHVHHITTTPQNLFQHMLEATTTTTSHTHTCMRDITETSLDVS